jgi:hypothetical protein
VVGLERWVADNFATTNGLTKGKETSELDDVGTTVYQSVLVNRLVQDGDQVSWSLGVVQSLGVQSLVHGLDLRDGRWREFLFQVHLLSQLTGHLGPVDGLGDEARHLVNLVGDGILGSGSSGLVTNTLDGLSDGLTEHFLVVFLPLSFKFPFNLVFLLLLKEILTKEKTPRQFPLLEFNWRPAIGAEIYAKC